MRRPLIITTLLCAALISGCATSPPRNPGNACAVFKEKGGWYEDAEKARKRWGTPVHVSMAIMYHESGYRGDAKPPRAKFLWVIPMPWRVSDAYGYPQAKDGTWDWYKKSGGYWSADRDDFGDAIDFIAWYVDVSHKKLGLSKWDARSNYLAYHEGHGGYQRGTYKRKAWLQKRASVVASTAKRYQTQIASCKDDLDDGGWFF